MIRNSLVCIVYFAIILLALPCFSYDSKVQLTPAEKAWLKQNHIVRVRISNAAPFMMTENGIRGIAVDYLTTIFKKHGIKSQYIPASQVTWPQALEYIKEHRVVDLLPTAKITEERKKNMTFTDEYIFAPLVIFTRTDSPFIGSMEDLNTKTVSVQEGWVVHKKLQSEYPAIKLRVTSAKLKDSATRPIKDLSTGLADAYIGNLLMTTYTIQQKAYTNLQVAAPTLFDNHNQAMAVRNDWPELTSIINKELRSMTPEEHAAIRSKWLSIKYEYGIKKTDILKWVISVLLFSSVIIIIVLLWNRRLKTEISSREKVEKTLRESRSLLNDVGAIAKIGGWELDILTMQVKWTQETYNIVEINDEQPAPSVDERFKYFLPEYKDIIDKAFENLIKKDTPLEFEAKLRTAKGNIKWCRAIGRSIRKDGKCLKLHGTFQDITEKKNREKEQKKQESLFEKIFNTLPLGIWIADKNGKLLRGNPEGIRIWGAEPHVDPSEYGIFKARRHPSGEEIAPDEWALAHTLTHGATIIDEMIEIDAFDEVKRIVLNSTIPVLNDNNEIQAAIVINNDITERKDLEDKLRRAQKIEAIGVLAGGIAHDFNNILFPIIGFAEMSIEDLPEDNPVRENLEDILQGAKRARDLVKQILSFSTQVELKQKATHLKSLIEEAIKLLRPAVPSNIEIKLDLPEKEIFILANATEIHEVIINLCTNAYHAMEKKGGTLTISLNMTEPISELDLSSGEYCCLSIKDTGSGIPPDILDHIFNPYFTTKEQGKGTGLGLSVSHGIVKSHNGAINIKSKPDKGTIVNVFLPITSKNTPLPETKINLEQKSGKESILFVDDEQVIVKLGKRILERMGYTVTGMISSTEALELFRSDPDRFDLVITDMTMPKLIGTELAQKILEIRKDMPILICTGFSEQVDKETAATYGIKGYINKPILADDLLLKIRELLDKVKRK